MDMTYQPAITPALGRLSCNYVEPIYGPQITQLQLDTEHGWVTFWIIRAESPKAQQPTTTYHTPKYCLVYKDTNALPRKGNGGSHRALSPTCYIPGRRGVHT